MLLNQLPRLVPLTIETQAAQTTATEAETELVATTPEAIQTATPTQASPASKPTLESPFHDFIGSWTTTTHQVSLSYHPEQLELKQTNEGKLVLRMLHDDTNPFELTQYTINEASGLAITFYSGGTYYHLSLTEDNKLRFYSRWDDRTIFYSKDEAEGSGTAQASGATPTPAPATFRMFLQNDTSYGNLTLFVNGVKSVTIQGTHGVYLPAGEHIVSVCAGHSWQESFTECGQSYTVEVDGPMVWRFFSLGSMTFDNE